MIFGLDTSGTEGRRPDLLMGVARGGALIYLPEETSAGIPYQAPRMGPDSRSFYYQAQGS